MADTERQQMSNKSTGSDQDPGQVLLDLEQDYLETYSERCFEVFRGPFGFARWGNGRSRYEQRSVDVDVGLVVHGGDVGRDDALTR